MNPSDDDYVQPVINTAAADMLRQQIAQMERCVTELTACNASAGGFNVPSSTLAMLASAVLATRAAIACCEVANEDDEQPKPRGPRQRRERSHLTLVHEGSERG